MKNNLFIISLFILVLLSCNKQKAISNDTEKPVVNIVEPNSLDTITLSIDPELHIEFTASDNIGLNTISVKLFDANSNLLFSADPSVNKLKVYPYHTHYIPSGIVSSTMLKVMIDANDLAGNGLHKEISVVVKP
jgi:hypothetical protein